MEIKLSYRDKKTNRIGYVSLFDEDIIASVLKIKLKHPERILVDIEIEVVKILGHVIDLRE